MIHVREQDPTKPAGVTRIRCGLATMPAGDTMFFEGDSGAWLTATCEGCNPGGPKQLGTPISQLSDEPDLRRACAERRGDVGRRKAGRYRRGLRRCL